MISAHDTIRRFLVATVAVAALAAGGLAHGVPAAWAGTVVLKACSAYGDAGSAFAGASAGNLTYTNACGQGRALQLNTLGTAIPGYGASASWQTTSPPAVAITYAITPVNDVLVDPDPNHYYTFDFTWDGGSQAITPQGNCCGGMDYGLGINRALPPSHHFGWQAQCQTFNGCPTHQLLDVQGVYLDGEDDTPPSVIADGAGNVFYTSNRWIRGGGWPASFTASADAGICNMQTLVGGSAIQGPGPFAPNQGSWTQCPTPQTQSYTLDTTRYANGALPLTFTASDPASPANVSSPSTTLHIDNTPVSLSLTGPTDVAASAANASAAITATATAGPSGVDIFCSVDGGAMVEYRAQSAQVPVSGLGAHHASCFAQNGAFDTNGVLARSATQTFNLSIRQPTAQAVTFARIADALRCRRVVEKLKVRGKPRLVRRHGKKVLVRGRSRTVKESVRRCHARTAKRKVWVVLKRHGKVVERHGKPVRVREVKRVVLLPRTVSDPKRRIGHGKATTVSGYLGLPDGAPLPGRSVAVIAAPDNGLGQFTLPVATVTTSASGTWTATVPAGPSRLIEAVYSGSATEEPASSAPVTLTVPARIRLLSVTPRVPWGGTVQIAGKLSGGYLPPGGAFVRLRYGYGRHARSTFGVIQHVTGSGRFATSFTFGPGPARLLARYWFSASLLAQPDYPFAAASSPRRYVLVGGHPRVISSPPGQHHHQTKKHRRRHAHHHTANKHHHHRTRRPRK